MRNGLSIAMIFLTLVFSQSCKNSENVKSAPIQLMILDPGHFHAALVQKSMYPEIDQSVDVYAEEGDDFQSYMDRVDSYNTRTDSPTAWKITPHLSKDFLKKMMEEKAGNVVVLAGNNGKKTEYIVEALNNGLHVFADKPMAINLEDFSKLVAAFETAKEKNLLLYDIMTERFEISTILQRALSQESQLFGTLETGTKEQPAITKESVHHFYKMVSGNPLVRPAWFFDVEQQGEGIADVTTHLVDLVMWECFPETIIDHNTEVDSISAAKWPTFMSPEEFNKVTKSSEMPDFLTKNVIEDGSLSINANGEITFKIKGIWAKVSVIWNYQAPQGAGDTHYSIMRGSKADLVIQQGEKERYIPELYILPKEGLTEADVLQTIASISKKFSGLGVTKQEDDSYLIDIPEAYRNGHEAHFTQVTENFIAYFMQNKLPEWEVPNMITKYFITTQGQAKAEVRNTQ